MILKIQKFELILAFELNEQFYRLLMDEMQIEQRIQLKRTESKKQFERSLIVELERLQRDIDIAKQNTELHQMTAETLRKEVKSTYKDTTI